MALSSQQLVKLKNGLIESFTDFGQFNMFLVEQTGRPLNGYAGPNAPMPVAVFQVIQGAEAEGWLERLVVGAVATRPRRPEFAEVATELGFTAAGPNLTNARPIEGRPSIRAHKVLEDVVAGRERFINVAEFLAAMSAAQSRVCAIRLPDSKGRYKFGTGFLVGPDLVLTNFHVLERVIANQVNPRDVLFRFDMLIAADGRTLLEGVPYRLHPEKWLVDQSPYSANDLHDPLPADPSSDELDYCVVRLATAAGEDRSGGSQDPRANSRGWMPLSADRSAGTEQDNIFILQHPIDFNTQQCRPLKLAIGNHLGFAGGGRRMRYDADTLGGSSGAPVLNADFDVIGLHHRGDPNADTVKMTAEHNQGIPINRIVELLAQRKIAKFWQ